MKYNYEIGMITYSTIGGFFRFIFTAIMLMIELLSGLLNYISHKLNTRKKYYPSHFPKKLRVYYNYIYDVINVEKTNFDVIYGAVPKDIKECDIIFTGIGGYSKGKYFDYSLYSFGSNVYKFVINKDKVINFMTKKIDFADEKYLVHKFYHYFNINMGPLINYSLFGNIFSMISNVFVTQVTTCINKYKTGYSLGQIFNSPVVIDSEFNNPIKIKTVENSNGIGLFLNKFFERYIFRGNLFSTSSHSCVCNGDVYYLSVSTTGLKYYNSMYEYLINLSADKEKYNYLSRYISSSKDPDSNGQMINYKLVDPQNNPIKIDSEVHVMEMVGDYLTFVKTNNYNLVINTYFTKDYIGNKAQSTFNYIDLSKLKPYDHDAVVYSVNLDNCFDYKVKLDSKGKYFEIIHPWMKR